MRELIMQELQELGIKPLKVAQYFIDQCDISAGDSVTHLKIQKLLYYTQAWGLVIIKKSFFKEKFQQCLSRFFTSVFFIRVFPSIFSNILKNI